MTPVRLELVAQSETEVIKCFSCSIQLIMKLILLINVEISTIIGILTFISKINSAFEFF